MPGRCAPSDEFSRDSVDRIPGDDWTRVTVPIDEELLTDEFELRFLFGSDRGVTDEGWYIDDVEIAIGG